VGVLFVHVGIDFVAKGIVVLKGGKRVHRAGITASAVPRAEGLTTEDTEGTERIFWLKFIDAAPTSGALLAGGDTMARGKKVGANGAAPSGRLGRRFKTKKGPPFAGSPFGFNFWYVA
jgi:hypothetical protein